MNFSPEQYSRILKSIDQTLAEFEAVDYNYLLPAEKETLKKFPFFPARSIEYFTRSQAVDLLLNFQIGITLEGRLAGLDIDKNGGNDKVAAQ